MQGAPIIWMWTSSCMCVDREISNMISICKCGYLPGDKVSIKNVCQILFHFSCVCKPDSLSAHNGAICRKVYGDYKNTSEKRGMRLKGGQVTWLTCCLMFGLFQYCCVLCSYQWQNVYVWPWGSGREMCALYVEEHDKVRPTQPQNCFSQLQCHCILAPAALHNIDSGLNLYWHSCVNH